MSPWRFFYMNFHNEHAHYAPTIDKVQKEE